MARTLVVSVLAVLAAAVLAGPAAARDVVLRDGEGRTIRFDVRADADVEWYAGLLRRAAHCGRDRARDDPHRRLGRARASAAAAARPGATRAARETAA